MRALRANQGLGNVMLITHEHKHCTEVFAAFGEKMVRVEAVAEQVLHQARGFVASSAAVGEPLANQMMLPMALAGGRRFTAQSVSQHASTNAGAIARFLAVDVTVETGKGRSTCIIKSTCQAA